MLVTRCETAHASTEPHQRNTAVRHSWFTRRARTRSRSARACDSRRARSLTRRRPRPRRIHSGSTKRSSSSARTPCTRIVANPTTRSPSIATRVRPSRTDSSSKSSASGWARRLARSPSLDNDDLQYRSRRATTSSGSAVRMANPCIDTACTTSSTRKAPNASSTTGTSTATRCPDRTGDGRSSLQAIAARALARGQSEIRLRSGSPAGGWPSRHPSRS